MKIKKEETKSMRSHTQTVGENEQGGNNFKCDACPKTFSSLPELVEHVKVCDVDRYFRI